MQHSSLVKPLLHPNSLYWEMELYWNRLPPTEIQRISDIYPQLGKVQRSQSQQTLSGFFVKDIDVNR